MSPLILKKFDSGVLHISLNNADKSNALTGAMMREIIGVLKKAATHPETRVIVLRGEGKSFCTGIDLKHLDENGHYSKKSHKEDVKLLSDLLSAVADCPLPVISIGHGNVFGAGIGLLAAADIAVAMESTTFCFSEVNLGLIPGIISPYVVARIGLTNARRFFLTGELFHWWDAKEMNLVSYVGTKMACFEFLNTVIANLKKAAPGAQAETKKLLKIFVGQGKRPANLVTHLIDLTSRRRFSREGQQGVHAFLRKEDPPWRS